jgi:hypothetical protein
VLTLSYCRFYTAGIYIAVDMRIGLTAATLAKAGAAYSILLLFC